MVRLLQIVFIIILSIKCFAQAPTVNILNPARFCSNTSLTFSSQTTNSPTSFSWSVSPASSVTASPDYNSQNITLNFKNSGVYVISLLVSNASGTATASNTIQITKSAKAAFNASLTSTGYPTSLVLTNYSSNSNTNQWLFSDDVNVNTTSFNTIKNYSISGNYSVSLIAYGNAGCNDTSNYSFRIADSSGVILPTIFSPNGDEVNDVFKPIAIGISSMNVWIYNRFGTIIHNWDRVNGSWDGHTTSGERCEAGVYFVVLEATGFDGKSYKLKHSLTLVR